MNNKRTVIFAFAILILACAFYRVFDDIRPFGFAPQIAMALFAGSVIKDKKFSFLVPLLSMLISDLIYQFLFQQGHTNIAGFYKGQAVNYALFTAITAIGFFVKRNRVTHIIAGSLAGAVFFFVASNFLDWAGGGLDIHGQAYPKSWEGLMSCFAAGIPFFKGSLWATLFFSAIFFGGYYLLERRSLKLQSHSA